MAILYLRSYCYKNGLNPNDINSLFAYTNSIDYVLDCLKPEIELRPFIRLNGGARCIN